MDLVLLRGRVNGEQGTLVQRNRSIHLLEGLSAKLEVMTGFGQLPEAMERGESGVFLQRQSSGVALVLCSCLRRLQQNNQSKIKDMALLNLPTRAYCGN